MLKLCFFTLLSVYIEPSVQLDLSSIPTGGQIPLDDLWEMGKETYFEGDYATSIKILEKALVTYRMMRHVDIACNRKCLNANINKDLPDLDFTKYNDLFVLGNLVAEANCRKLCIEEHPYGVSAQHRPSAKVIEAFQLRQPYDFLQFSYFKTNLIKQACQAVQTYYQAHLQDQSTLNNIDYYKTLDNVTDADFKDLEATKFYKYFVAGVDAYTVKNYKEVVANIEKALTEYFVDHEECELLCYQPFSHTHFRRFYRALAGQYMDYLGCCLSCQDKLNPVVSGYPVQKVVARCYAYLQFAYYQLGKVQMAAPCAAAGLLLNPDDVDAQKNMKFYMESASQNNLSASVHLGPRADAVKFHKHLTDMLQMQKECNEVFDDGDEGTVDEIEDLSSEHVENDVLSDLNEQIMKRIEDRLQNI
uniref:Cartilage-associated protein-like n=1 Tax=Phallusia mammillata TaxID=59560 RepID=A0A6F9DAM2_9ASCI|nr:cartilage-associated protein-like [Phallusia mammillata]